MPAIVQIRPVTNLVHSHSTAAAAAAQNTANGQPPKEPAASAIGPSTAAETMRNMRLLTGSGSDLRDQAAKPALALLIFADRRLERGAVEIRPIGRHEHQFAIGRLPEQEIRQPLL